MPPGATDSVQQARVRARHRLIGSAVLVAIGLVVFPMIFESEPRPVSPDIPIEIARRDAPRLAAGDSGAGERSEVRAPTPDRAGVITETAAEAGREIPTPAPQRSAAARASAPPLAAAPKPTAPAVPKVAAPVAPKPVVPPPAKPVAPPPAPPPKPAVAVVKPPPVPKPAAATASRPAPVTEARAVVRPTPGAEMPVAPGEAARARSLLEGKEGDSAKVEKADNANATDKSESAAGARYVIQVGAFADRATAHATRLRVERLGLKTYTHVAQTPGGERTRVRVGPVASRSEAEQVQAKLRAAGITAALLTL